MMQLKRQLEKIDEQKRLYRILLNRSRYREKLEDRVWAMAADLTSRFDLIPDESAGVLQSKNKEGLLGAF